MPPDRLMEDEPGAATTVPPQSLVSSLGDAITRPVGKLSVNAIPFSVIFVFGLLMVKLNRVVPSCATLSGRKSLLIVGEKNGFTVTVSAAEGAPVQPRVVTVTV